jgi:GR25 family glycosyltransferase involved in LPS biosynthesis|tara:strand:- start:43 stop:834 length:792 start_codon:yes stop_codon:yes gene_type:complete
MKVWVLNCKHAKVRREKISKSLDKEGVDYTIHEALYWKDKDFQDNLDKHKMSIYDNWSSTSYKDDLPDGMDNHISEWYDRGIRKGEAAVCASTILMLESMLQTSDDYFFALQDDATWEKGEISRLIDLIEKDMKEVERADILWLAGNNVDYRGSDIPIKENWSIPRFTYNAHAIVYSRKGIKRILNSGIKKTLMSYDEYLNILHRVSYRTDIIKDINPEPFRPLKLRVSTDTIWQECPVGDEAEWVDRKGYASDIVNSDIFEE